MSKKKRNKYYYSDFTKNFFEKIDTEGKAYILGFLFADGWVESKTNRVGISLKKDDIDILKDFKKYMKLENEIKIRKDRDQCTIFIYNKKIKKDLINRGCVPNKSLKLKPPNDIPNRLVHHFIRGYVDGDGYFYISENDYGKYGNFGIAGTKYLLEYISDKLPVKYNVYRENNYYRYRVKNYKNILKIGEYLYNNCNIFLKRKKDIFEQIKSLKICNKGKYSSCAKPVLQLDLDGNFIKEWGCITSAHEKLGVPRSCISKVCKGKLKTSGGFKWEYKFKKDKI